MKRIRLGVDVGGTFTDLVALIDGEQITAKVPSTPNDQSEGVMNSIRAAGVSAEEILFFAHGMTVATNALLERRGARVALVTTEGFRDILEIGRQNRPSLYSLSRNRPPQLIPRELRFTVKERTGPQGVIAPLDEESLEVVVRALKEADVEAVAVCLLFSFLYPEHERRVGEELRKALPGVYISLSSDVLPEFREYERFSTTAVNAYLSPKLSAYLGALAGKVRESGMPVPLVMQSSGGVIEIEDVAGHAAACVLSGPAGGVVGASYVAGLSGYRDLLTFDMGGTSTDVAPVLDGETGTTTESVVAGVPIRIPMVDVHTVSAGGGSIAWVDAGRALRAGPHSAGADPGPACYGRGGDEPTVTDASLALGYLADGKELGGEVALNRQLSLKALEKLGKELGLEPVEAALGILRVADAEMVRALKVISVQRGLDPRGFAMVAFGGAGGIHACSLAEELGIRKVLVPRESGVLSAFGLAIADLRRDYVRPFLASLDSIQSVDVERTYVEMERTSAMQLDSPEFQRRADLRYQGQSFELTVQAGGVQELAERFHAAHEERYGYRMEEEPVEVVNLRLTATVAGERPQLHERETRGEARSGYRKANFGGEWVQTPVWDRTVMGVGSEVVGPAVVEFPEATCVVRPGWLGVVDSVGTLVLERQ